MTLVKGPDAGEFVVRLGVNAGTVAVIEQGVMMSCKTSAGDQVQCGAPC